MEIKIQRRMTGRDMQKAILDRYGDKAALEALARKGDAKAKDALFNLRLLEEDPTRLGLETVVEDTMVLGTNDLSKLTQTRLRILEVLRRMGETNVKDLTKALRRDPKNVSRDVACLEAFGLVDAHRHGKAKFLRPAGNRILISV